MIKTLLNYLITCYQLTLSGLIGNQCRFYPSCSQYTREAISRHGALKGSALGLRRVCSCHPWHEGGYDPVPGTEPEPTQK
ncbi:MAG: membrane protein insertion efficiency factor YidD [Gammaproteobacteria bacterium]